MVELVFIPESTDFAPAAKSYSFFWKTDGAKIITTIENATHLSFKEKKIEVTVYEGISQSHPMKLRASNDDETKKATIVHELMHIISADYMLPLPEPQDALSLGLHKQINLVLYDAWNYLFGQAVADRQVIKESSVSQTYKFAWDWAMLLSKEERAQAFAKLLPESLQV